MAKGTAKPRKNRFTRADDIEDLLEEDGEHEVKEASQKKKKKVEKKEEKKEEEKKEEK